LALFTQIETMFPLAMQALTIFIKCAGVAFTTLLVISCATGDELTLHVGTAILVLLTSVILFFARPVCLRALALVFLLLAIGVSHAVDRYFWMGVWNHGYPWPYPDLFDDTRDAGVVGSISPFMDEVSTVCFLVLLITAALAFAFYLGLRSKQG